MPATLESSGEIEIICDTSNLGPSKTAKLVFRTFEDISPPFQIVILSPSGSVILKRVIRALPTGQPQSPLPISFAVQKGDYQIEISELSGGAVGRAVLHVS